MVALSGQSYVQSDWLFSSELIKSDKKMQQEIWKVVNGYEGIYEVSNLGRVKSIGREVLRGKNHLYQTKTRILSLSTSGRYQHIRLYNNGTSKRFYIHHLVCFVFLGYERKDSKIVVDHINNVGTDNRLVNLQVITQRENLSKENRGNSKYTGVHFYKRDKKWMAYISINSKRKHLGYFDNEYDAHLEYKRALSNLKLWR